MTPEETGADIRTNVLLVDDRPQNLLALQAILEPLGQNLVLASSGREALKHVLASDFAVILLDVLMPDLDGFETAKLIKAREQSKAIPIIFLTAVSTHEQFVFQGYSVGAVDYMSKPFDPEILRSKVAVFVDLFRKREHIKRQAEQLRLAQQRERELEIASLKRESDRRYQSLAESLPQLVWSMAADGNITYGNRPWFEIGSPGLPLWKELVLGEDLQLFERSWKAGVESRNAFEMELRMRPAPGAAHRWFLVRVAPALEPRDDRAPTDPAPSWVITCTDIDDRRRAEDTLRLLAEASTVLAGSLDYHVAIPRVARLAVESVAEWCIVDLIAKDGVLRRIAVANADPAEADLARELEGLPVRELEDDVLANGSLECLLLVDGTSMADRAKRCFSPLECVAAPIDVRGRRVGQIALALRPLERKGASRRSLVEHLARKMVISIDNAQLHETARQEHARLEEASRAKDEFLAIVSHELRTPLNAVLGWAHVLRTPGLDPATGSLAIDTIERNAKSQARLIGDILDVSRITSGKLRLNLSQVDLADVIASAVDSIRPEAEAKGVELRCEALPPARLVGDPERLEQIAWNLLSNAVKFTPEDGFVEIRVRGRDDVVELEVADSGAGIDRDFLPHIFDRFTQGDATPSRSHGGLGLGLSIVRHLVVLHGGSVRAHSEGPGRGSTFTVELSRRLASTSDARRAAPRASKTSRALDGLRVLVVEDARDSREFLDRVLSDHGAEVVAVGSAAEALESLSERPYDLLLSDIGLPGANGYDLIREVRSFARDLPAVALTAYAGSADRERALGAGFQAHVAKPIDIDDLIATLEGLFPRRRPDAAQR